MRAQGAAAPGPAQEAQRSDGRRIHSEGLDSSSGQTGPGLDERTDISGQSCSLPSEVTVASSLYYHYLHVMRDEGPSGESSPRTAARARRASPPLPGATVCTRSSLRPSLQTPSANLQTQLQASGRPPPVLPAPAPRDPSHFFISEPGGQPAALWLEPRRPEVAPSCGGTAACLLWAPRSTGPIPIQPRPVLIRVY